MTGGRKAHFGLRSSIAGRWTFNTLSVVGVLLIIANVCIYYFTRQYYYGSAETYLVSEANATATVLTRLYEDMAVNYSTEVRELIEGFDKKDKMEMMSINKNGEVTLSSSGFSPDESYNMPDYEAALKSEDGVGVFHGYETGENIIAVTVMIAQPSSSYSALRYVSSMKLIDQPAFRNNAHGAADKRGSYPGGSVQRNVLCKVDMRAAHADKRDREEAR